jgi:hypothetical protein
LPIPPKHPTSRKFAFPENICYFEFGGLIMSGAAKNPKIEEIATIFIPDPKNTENNILTKDDEGGGNSFHYVKSNYS